MENDTMSEDSGPYDLEDTLKELHQMIFNPCEELERRCDELPFHVFLMGKGFLVVFFLAMFGNFINLLIYKSEQIRFYIAIRMLCSRLLMNSLAMLFLLPQALRTVGLWEPNSPEDHLYWSYYPYQAYFVNVFGFSAMWLTVLMTGECFMHVYFPTYSKSVVTKKNLSKSYAIIFIVGLVLALNYPLNRRANVSEDACKRIIVSIQASNDATVQHFERLHTVAHLLLSIIIPMGLLLYMTIAIVWRLLLRKSEFPSSSHFTAEKKCVTRITLITTSLQLLAELPPIPVFIYAAISGPQVINEPAICIWNTIGIFLGLCNMSLSFFVYLALSQKFRQMVWRRLGEVYNCIFCCTTSKNSKILSFDACSDHNLSRNLLNKSIKEATEFPTDTFLMTERSASITEDAFL